MTDVYPKLDQVLRQIHKKFGPDASLMIEKTRLGVCILILDPDKERIAERVVAQNFESALEVLLKAN